MELASSFPARLREAMGNLTVTELANSLGISKQSVSAYLTGSRKPKRFVIEAIAAKLNVDPAWLCGFDVPKYCDATVKNELTSSDRDKLANEVYSLYVTLSPAKQAELLRYARYLASTPEEP